jgi:PadR family transcriptional regulator AphA
MHPDITGYQLKSIIDTSSDHMARLHLNRIYPALRKMTEEGRLSCRNIPVESHLDQKYYSLTSKGHEVLREWLSQPFESAPTRSCFDEYLIELSAIAWMGPERICSYIDEGIAWLEKLLSYQTSSLEPAENAFVPSGDADQDVNYLTLWKHGHDYIISETQSRLSWLKQLRETYTPDSADQ